MARKVKWNLTTWNIDNWSLEIVLGGLVAVISNLAITPISTEWKIQDQPSDNRMKLGYSRGSHSFHCARHDRSSLKQSPDADPLRQRGHSPYASRLSWAISAVG